MRKEFVGSVALIVFASTLYVTRGHHYRAEGSQQPTPAAVVTQAEFDALVELVGDFESRQNDQNVGFSTQIEELREQIELLKPPSLPVDHPSRSASEMPCGNDSPASTDAHPPATDNATGESLLVSDYTPEVVIKIPSFECPYCEQQERLLKGFPAPVRKEVDDTVGRWPKLYFSTPSGKWMAFPPGVIQRDNLLKHWSKYHTVPKVKSQKEGCGKGKDWLTVAREWNTANGVAYVEPPTRQAYINHLRIDHHVDADFTGWTYDELFRLHSALHYMKMN